MHHPVQRVKALSQGENGRGFGMTTALFIVNVKQRGKAVSPLSSVIMTGQRRNLLLLHCYKENFSKNYFMRGFS